MELIHYWRVVRRWSWLVILCPLIGALAAGLITLQLPNVYEAQVLLLVRPAQPLSGGPNVSVVTSDTILHTYATLMTDQPRAQQVIDDLGLKTDPTSLLREVTVTPVTGTLLLKVAVRDTNPARAKSIADTLVPDFLNHMKDLQKSDQKTAAEATLNPADILLQEAPAIVPPEPVSPRPLLNIALGLLSGLALGLGLAFLLDYLDQSVRSDEILRERVGLAPLGHISYVVAKPDKRGELVTLAGDSPVGEAYKALR